MKTIFFDKNERRLRAGWRIALTTTLAFSLLIIAAVLFQTEFGINIALAFILIFILYFASSVIDKRPFADFGFNLTRVWIKDFLAGNVIAIISMTALVLFQYWVGWLTFQEVNSEYFEINFLKGATGAFGLMVAVSIWEEAYFRSYLITNLKEGFSYNLFGEHGPIILAVFISSCVFGLAHISNPNASWFSTANIAIAGVVLAYPYVVSKSIAIPVGMHLSWNYFQGVVFGLPVSGQKLEPVIFYFAPGGPDIFTGGSFGPEAGIAGLSGLFLMWSLSYFYITAFYKK